MSESEDSDECEWGECENEAKWPFQLSFEDEDGVRLVVLCDEHHSEILERTQ